MFGGSAEVIGGRKFANGAVTGAFVGLFNDGMHQGEDDKKLIDLNSKSAGDEIVELMREVEMKSNNRHISEYFTEESIPHGKTTYLKYESKVAGSVVEITIINPKQKPDLGSFYMVKDRDFNSVGRASFGTIDLAGQYSVVSIKFYNENIYNKTYNYIFHGKD